jgi:dihydrodipicolinate reductase
LKRAPAVAASGRGPIVQKADDIDVLADVLIDFWRADAVSNAIACARRADAALLVGTTGLASATVDALRRESGARAVLLAPTPTFPKFCQRAFAPTSTS